MTRQWHSLPTEILELFASLLPSNALPRFALACKAWQRSIPVHVHSTMGSPLLAYFPRSDGVCHLYSPLCDKTFVSDPDPPPILRRAFPQASKGGWLVLFQAPEKKTILLYNPFSPGSLRSFEVPFHYSFTSVGLSAPPTNPDYLFFGIRSSYEPRVYVTLCRGESEWILQDGAFDNNYPFAGRVGTNPVFLNNRFYVLGKHGQLGVFDTAEITWTVLERPWCIHIHGVLQNFLVESVGELFWVLARRSGEIRAFKLNSSTMNWEALEGAVDHSALFVGWPVSLSSTVRGMGNKIYFTKFHQSASVEVVRCRVDNYKDEPLFVVPRTHDRVDCEGRDSKSRESMIHYSTRTRRFCPAATGIFQCTREHLSSVWIEPRFA